MKSILFLCMYFASSSFAGPIVEFPPSQLTQAVALVNEYITGRPHRHTDIWNELVAMKPRGPSFTDQALALLADDERPWKTYSEPRKAMLTLVEESVRTSVPWQDFDGSALKQSIHRSAQKLLSKFPIARGPQRDLVSIYDHLHLWDETDLPFLMKKFFNRSLFTPEISEFLKWFEKGSPELKSEFADRIRRKQKKALLEYAVLYRFQLIHDDEVIWLLRLFMSDLMYGIAGESEQARPLLQWVLLDLHTRLRQGDAPIVAAYNKATASPNWGGNQVWSDENLEGMRQFLRDLWTGKNITNCEPLLVTVPSDDVRATLASLLPAIEPWRNANRDDGAAFYARAMVADIPLDAKQIEFLGKHATAEFLPGLEGLLRALEFAAGRTGNMSLTMIGMKLEKNVRQIQDRSK